MNKNIPKAAWPLLALLASTPTQAEEITQPRKTPAVQSSSDSVELCREVFKSMFIPGSETSLEFKGQDSKGAPHVTSINTEIGFNGMKVECDLAKDMSFEDLLVNGLEDAENLGTVNITEGDGAKPAVKGTGKDGITPPYIVVDYSKNNKPPDGNVDNVCTKNACRPLRSYTPDQQKTFKLRFKKAVRAALAKLKNPGIFTNW